MTEQEVRQIAENYVIERSLNKCSIEDVRFTKRSDIEDPDTEGDEWVVLFRFDTNDEEEWNSPQAIVIVDDANGKPSLFTTL